MKLCNKCGAPLDEGVRFCKSCGQPVEAEEGVPSEGAAKDEAVSGKDNSEKTNSLNETAEPSNADDAAGTSDEAAGKAESARNDGSREKGDAGFGGKRKKLTILAIAAVVVIAIIGIATYCPHEEWEPATCTTAKRCKRCGKEEGAPLGHDWEAATCLKPKKCKRCGKKEGKALGHKPGEWSSGELEPLSASIVSEKKCSVCGEVLDKRNEKLNSFVSDGELLLSPADLEKRLSLELACIENCSLSVELDTGSDSTLVLREYRSSTEVASAAFSELTSMSADSLIDASKKNEEKSFRNVIFFYEKGDNSSTYVAQTLFALIQAMDPQMSDDFDDTKAAAKELTEQLDSSSSTTSATVEKNGITYSMGFSKGEWILGARIK